MPCRDEYAEAQDNRDVREKLNNVTRYLCTVLTQLEEARILKDYGSNEILLWWEQHKEADKQRIAREQKADKDHAEALRADIRRSQAQLDRLEKKGKKR